MIIFTVPKAFEGRFSIIQENAIDSWLSLKPKPTIYLFGDEKGVEEIAQKKRLIHIKNVKKNKRRTPLLDDVFEKAQKRGRKEILMYINTDIVLLNSPFRMIEKVKKQFPTFLMIGKRHEAQIDKRMTIDEIKRLFLFAKPKLKGGSWMDYFIFTNGVFKDIPPFALGRTFWDKWLIWKTQKDHIPVVDITQNLFAIHQSHSYSQDKRTNMRTVWSGEEATKNLVLAGGWSHMRTIDNADYHISKNKLTTKQRKIHLDQYILSFFPTILWPFLLKLRLFREKIRSTVY